MSNEIFIAIMLFKNVVLYGFSEFVNSWTASAGPFVVYSVFGGIGLAIVFAAVPIYVFGKKYVSYRITRVTCRLIYSYRYRSFWARHNLLEKLGVKTHPEI